LALVAGLEGAQKIPATSRDGGEGEITPSTATSRKFSSAVGSGSLVWRAVICLRRVRGYTTHLWSLRGTFTAS